MSAQRKPMNEALAKSLVFNNPQPAAEKPISEIKDVVDFTPETPVEVIEPKVTEPVIEEKPAQKPKSEIGGETKRFTMDIPKPLHAKFSVIAIHLDKDKSEIMLELLKEFVDKNSKLLG